MNVRFVLGKHCYVSYLARNTSCLLRASNPILWHVIDGFVNFAFLPHRIILDAAGATLGSLISSVSTQVVNLACSTSPCEQQALVKAKG